jgi:PTS system D-glucosamine-specific IIC component
MFDSRLKQNIAWSCYYQAKTITDISKELEVPIAYIEGELRKLVEWGYIDQVDSSKNPKYLTNMYITDSREDFSEELLAKIAAGLGGKKNIGDIDCCVTRLRCGLKDISLVDDAMIKETGSRGILKRGNSIQIIYGPYVTVLKSELEDYLRTRRAKKEIKQLLKENTHSKDKMQQESIACPIKGCVIELEEVGDEAFSGGMLGEGFAVKPEEGKLYAPVDGIIAAVFRTKHALAMESKDGAEVLIHLGLDTVKRGGKGFYMKVEAGQKVKKGELICEFDLEDMRVDGYVMTTPVVISNNAEYASISLKHIGECNVGEEILTLYK